MKKYTIRIIIIAAVLLLLLGGGVLVGVATKSADIAPAETVVETTAPTRAPEPSSHYIDNVPVTLQYDLPAGCETHAGIELLQYLGYDIDEYQFADNYLECRPVSVDDETGEMQGPDLNSAFAGDVYFGWGIYAPAMAKCMNVYLKDVKSGQKAIALENVSLEDLCHQYIDRDIPVMIWATVEMLEPEDYDAWQVDYVDENAKYKKGDTFEWPTLEHCMLLCGYDKDHYRFVDSLEGEIVEFRRQVSEQRYEQLGMQAVVVE